MNCKAIIYEELIVWSADHGLRKKVPELKNIEKKPGVRTGLKFHFNFIPASFLNL